MSGNERVAIDNSIGAKELLEYYWNYFDLHSGQRMKMINFYITVEVVLFGAFFTLLGYKVRMLWAEYLVAAAISFISLVFWGLDYRTKTLIHWCEDCIEELEQRYCSCFGQEMLLMKQSGIRTHTGCLRRITYSLWFTLLALAVGIVGLGCMYSLWKGYI